MLASIRFLLVAALVSTTVGSAVVPSASAAAPSNASGKKRYETSTAESGGSNQIFVGSDDITTDLRPTDGTNVGPPSKAVTEYLPPGTVFAELLKKGADGIPKKDESDEIFPAAMSDENIVGTTVSPSVKDAGMTIVTEECCYDCTDEATIWTLGGGSTIGTDETKNTNRNAVADVTSFDGTTNDVVKKEEEEDVPVGPITGPVGPTPVLSDDGNTNPGPADSVKTIITADHTMVDTTDVMAVLANLRDASTATSISTAEAGAKAVDRRAINGTAVDVDDLPESPQNGTDTTSTTSATSDAEVGGGNNNKFLQAPRINDEKDAIIIGPSSTISDNAKTIVTANHTMIDTTDAMAVIAGLLDDDNILPTLDPKKNDAVPGNAKPIFAEDLHIIHKILFSIPAYLPDPFEVIANFAKSIYTTVTTNSTGDVVSTAARSITEGTRTVVSGINDAATFIQDTVDELDGKLMEVIDSIDEADVKKISHGINVGYTFGFVVLSGFALDFFLFLRD